jgi:hypothetical protein
MYNKIKHVLSSVICYILDVMLNHFELIYWLVVGAFIVGCFCLLYHFASIENLPENTIQTFHPSKNVICVKTTDGWSNSISCVKD